MAVRATMASLITRVRLLIGLDVMPDMAAADIKDSRRADAKLYGKLTIADTLLMKLANFKHLLRGQFGGVMGLSSRKIRTRGISIPTLSIPINCIVVRSAKKEMFGVNARGGITMVANKHTIRNGAAIKLIGCTASDTLLPVNFERAVFLLVASFCASPKPTSVFTAAPVTMPNQSVFNFHGQDAFRFCHLFSFPTSIPHCRRTVKEVG